MKYTKFIAKILLLVTFSSVPFKIYALTLEEALTSGYTNDEELQIIRSDFLASIESFPSAIAEFMPKLSAKLDLTNSNITGKGPVAANNQLITSKTDSIRRTISLDQPIFDGWSSVAKLRSAQAGFMSSRAVYYAKEQEVFLKQLEIYLTYIEAQEKLSISEVSVKSNKTQLDAMQEKFRLGESTMTEVSSAKEGFATAESQKAIAYSNYESAKANFYQIFGIEPTNLVIPGFPKNMPNTEEELTNLALKMNLNIHNAKYKSQSDKANEYAAKGSLLPKAFFNIKNEDTGFSPQNNSSSINNKSITSTFSVVVPIFARGGAEYSEIRRAKQASRKSMLDFNRITKQVKAQSKSEWSRFKATKESLEATNESVNAAEIAYEGMIQEERLGSKTIIDVLRAESKLNEARQKVIEARKTMILSAYKIKQLIGEFTAKSMNLNVEYFEPEKEFKKVKMKVIGF